MNEEESLKTIEQESFRELRHDGLNEIIAGTLFLSFIVLIVEPGLLSIFVVWSVFAIIVMFSDGFAGRESHFDFRKCIEVFGHEYEGDVITLNRWIIRIWSMSS